MKDQVEKFKNLNEKSKILSEKKIRYEEQFKSRKQTLAELLREIKNDGCDPTKLDEAIAEEEKNITDSLNIYEKKLEEVSIKLAEIEGA